MRYLRYFKKLLFIFMAFIVGAIIIVAKDNSDVKEDWESCGVDARPPCSE